MNINSDNSLSEEINQSFDSSNLDFSFHEKEEKSSFIIEEPPIERKSKISLQLEKMKKVQNNSKENNMDISTDDVDNDVDIEQNEYQEYTQNSMRSSINIRKENIYEKFDIEFYFFFEQKEFKVALQTDVFNKNKNTVQDLIKNIINIINGKNIIFQSNKIKYILSLKDCEDEDDDDFYKDNYELKANESKENFAFSFDMLLSGIKNKKLKFRAKDYLNIMIRKL